MHRLTVWVVAVLIASLSSPPSTGLLAAEKGKAAKPAKATSRPVVAVFSLDRPITEKPRAKDFPFGSKRAISLHDLMTRMRRARDDKHVRAVVLFYRKPVLGLAQIEELRQVIDQLKRAGKDVYAHADSLSMGSYALLAGVTRLSVVPTGDVMITGLYGEQLYLRELLNKIGVQPDFLTCGAYKSAAEMFMRSGPSPEAEKMHSWLFDGLYDSYVTLIAEGRNVPTDKVRGWIDRAIYTAQSAKQAGMIDAVEYRQDFAAALKKKYGDKVRFAKRYGKKKRGEVDLSSPFAMFKFWSDVFQRSTKKKHEKNAIAIVHVDGPIVPGKPQPSLFGSGDAVAYSTPIRQALDKVANDKSVRGVVLRVSSPGGSVVASEIIFNATKRVAAKKPLVVSMGNVAASGGYYVSCGAETIFADRATITGSIGVVMGKLATRAMWKRIGVTWQPMRRGANAGLLRSSSPFTDKQRAMLQAWMNEVYGVFKGHVVAIRGKRLKKPIDDIAGGRVYTGNQALELGLVDKIGGLDAAVRYAAEKAGIQQYDVRVVPHPKSVMEILFSDLSDEDKDEDTLSLSRSLRAERRTLPSMLDTVLPILDGVEPARAAAIRRAFRQLETLAQDRILLVAPEIVFPLQ